MKACKLSKDIAPTILTSVMDGDAVRFNPGENAGTYCLGGWVGQIFCLWL